MSDMNLFYSSMSNVLSQWSDFRVSKGLYKEYFAMQKSSTKSAAEEAADKLTEKKTDKTKNNVADKLKTYANNLSSSISSLEKAFKEDEKTGEINQDSAYEAASKFVDSYNELVSSIRKSGNAAVSNRSEFIVSMTTAYTRRFGEVGITTSSDGTLKLDKEAFMKADAEDYAKVFGKDNSFASYMQTQAKGLAAFADTAEYLNPDPYTKVDTGAQSATNTNVTGYLFDKYL